MKPHKLRPHGLIRIFAPSFASHRPTGEVHPISQLATKHAAARIADNNECIDTPQTKNRAVVANARYERRVLRSGPAVNGCVVGLGAAAIVRVLLPLPACGPRAGRGKAARLSLKLAPLGAAQGRATTSVAGGSPLRRDAAFSLADRSATTDCESRPWPRCGSGRPWRRCCLRATSQAGHRAVQPRSGDRPRGTHLLRFVKLKITGLKGHVNNELGSRDPIGGLAMVRLGGRQERAGGP